MRRSTLLAAAAVLVAGCHYRPTPVPLAGDRSSIAALAGEWTGTYQGTQSGRTGSIAFIIQVSGDSAFGDVLMETPPGMPAIRPADDPVAHRIHARGSQLLAVRFVDIIGGDIEGALEPYSAPDCDCTVTTVFNGRTLGDTIRGTFLTRGQLIAPQAGVWAVMRKK
jgi:hypothetical protein